MSAPALREYQHKQLYEVMTLLQGDHNAVIMQSPTGTGKGYVAAYIFYRCLELKKSVWFIVHGRFVIDTFCTELAQHGGHSYRCDKCNNVFDPDVMMVEAGLGMSDIEQEEYEPIKCWLSHVGVNCDGSIIQSKSGIPHTRFQAGKHYDDSSKAVVASIDTITRRYFTASSKYKPEDLDIPDYIIVDECRKIVSPTCRKALDWYMKHGTKIIGLDATPAARGLNQVYTYMSHGQSTPWHISNGDLCPITHYAPNLKDAQFIDAVKEMRVNRDDYNGKDLDTLAENTVLIGNVVDQYEKITESEFGERKPFVVACVSRVHAAAVQSAFIEHGIPVTYVDGETPQAERDQIEGDLLSGKIMGVVSVLVMIYGVSIKCLQIAILARPVRNVTVYLQFGGRVLRTFLGKERSVMIDMGKAVHDIGFIDDEYSWDLEEEGFVNETRKQREEETEVEHVDITCSGCSFVYQNSAVCPKCGTKNLISYEEASVVYYNKELIKQDKEMKAAKSKWEMEQSFKAMLKSKVGRMRISNFDKMCKFNEVLFAKYKHTMKADEVRMIEPTRDDGTVKDFMTNLTIRRNAYKRRKW